MKKILLAIILVISLNSLFGQKKFDAKYVCFEEECYMDLYGLYDSLSLPDFLKDTNRIKMIDIHYNILIARVDNAILHYDLLTKKLDTLFYVYKETTITKPRWSPNNDKVAFLIYNPDLKYGYKTPFRFIILTLNNGKILKKEKHNVESVATSEIEDNDFSFNMENTKLVFYDENYEKLNIFFSKLSGNEPIIKDYEYIPTLNEGKIYKVKYLYKNLWAGDKKLLLHRYLCKRGKIIDLVKKDSVEMDIPAVDSESATAFWCDASPDDKEIAMYICTNPPEQGGELYIFTVPGLKLRKKITINDVPIQAGDSYYIDMKFADNNTIMYFPYDAEKDEFVRKYISIK